MNKKQKTSSGQSVDLMEAGAHFNSRLAKAIGKFIIEAGLGQDVLNLTSFKKMLQVASNRDQVDIPTYESILQEELKETEHRAMELKEEWKKSGCSLIMDSWKSRCGKRSFVSASVHCSKCMYFLRSIDVSRITEDMDELVLVFSRVVEDIGARNIIQVVTNDTSPHMRVAWHYVQRKHDHSFFTPLCADFCINLLLEKVAALEHVNEVATKAKEITRFIYGHTLPMELKGSYILEEILSSSCLKFVAVFITLERLVSARANLVQMFSSPEWISSGWASQGLFRHICGIIKTDDAFWCAAADVLKVTKPTVNVLFKQESEDCPMGILYGAMDSAKEDIKRNLGDNHGPYWDLVDRIQDSYLHIPLHAAGHMLDPRVLYKDLSLDDLEVSSGIEACATGMAKGNYAPRKLEAQIELYKVKSGTFGSDSASRQIMEIPEVDWWAAHGTGTPEVQSFATRVLSQTCFGTERYNINWQVSEEVHEIRPCIIQELYRGLEYAHYNNCFASAVPFVRGLSVDQFDKPGR